MEALGINLGYLLVQICMFGITFVVLRAWVYKPVLGLLARRREAIAQGLEDARVAAEARANAEKEASQILSEAQAKAAQMIREATERAEGAAREVRASADVEAGKARESALQEVEQERTRMLGELRGQVATLAIAAAQRIISDALDEQRQRALLDEFFSGLHSGKVVVLDGEDLSQGANAEVTSALPLTDKEQDTIKHNIFDRTGNDGSINFRVDPAILGGLVVRVGDKIMDGSIAGQLQSLRQVLN